METKPNQPIYLERRIRLFGILCLLLFLGMSGIALQGSRKSPLFGAALLLLCLMALLGLWAYHWICRPYRETTLLLGFISSDSITDHIRRIRVPYNPQMEQALKQVERYVAQVNVLEASRRHAQYQALQNQINPHFLYNTLESIRSEAVLSGLDSVDAMCEAMANYFRYTISNSENMVSLEEELANIRNYFTIQQYRFEDRLQLQIVGEQPEEVRGCLIPKLTLQPIVENAIIHGLERQVGTGTVTIAFTLTRQRLIILVSDNGLGMDEETLLKINQDIAEGTSRGSGRGGIAIGNVNNRIRLMFGEDYGVTVFSAQGAGTDVEITLPRTTFLDRARYQSNTDEDAG